MGGESDLGRRARAKTGFAGLREGIARPLRQKRRFSGLYGAYREHVAQNHGQTGRKSR